MNDAKIPKSRAKKDAVVADLSEKIGRSKALVFTNYQGLTHKQLEELKKGLKAANAELVIAKNTLLKIALQKSQATKEPITFEQPTATIFAYDDPIAALRELAKTIKALKLPSVKFGILDTKMISETDVLKLSTLPSRQVLLAQLVGGLKSPISGLHRALNWNLQKFVMTLKAIETKKT